MKVNNNIEKNSKIIFGGIIVLIGGLLLGRQFGLEIPHWLFSWKLFLIGLGIFIGYKNEFRDNSWLVLVLIGTIFLLIDWFDDYDLHKFIWPIGIIIFGLYVIFKSKRDSEFDSSNPSTSNDYFNSNKNEQMDVNENLNLSSTFSDVKRNIINKDFKTGNISVMFGAAEANLLQSDITETATINISQAFGSVRLRIPANWSIQSNSTSIFGSIDDKRFKPEVTDVNTKKLVIKGFVAFGSIEIFNF